jgi:hypothetical protein
MVKKSLHEVHFDSKFFFGGEKLVLGFKLTICVKMHFLGPVGFLGLR